MTNSPDSISERSTFDDGACEQSIPFSGIAPEPDRIGKE